MTYFTHMASNEKSDEPTAQSYVIQTDASPSSLSSRCLISSKSITIYSLGQESLCLHLSPQEINIKIKMTLVIQCEGGQRGEGTIEA